MKAWSRGFSGKSGGVGLLRGGGVRAGWYGGEFGRNGRRELGRVGEDDDTAKDIVIGNEGQGGRVEEERGS